MLRDESVMPATDCGIEVIQKSMNPNVNSHRYALPDTDDLLNQETPCESCL